MADIEKKTKRYPSDLTDEKWSRIQPFLPGASMTGRRVAGTCASLERDPLHGPTGWRLAHAAEGFPALADRLLVVPQLRAPFQFKTIHDVALMLDREREGREASPSGGVLDVSRSKVRKPRNDMDRGDRRCHRCVVFRLGIVV